eukprot:XP_016659620.1 PREDICTED: uncharacterized protein LOC107883660 [Acyrthosiphon pisum]
MAFTPLTSKTSFGVLAFEHMDRGMFINYISCAFTFECLIWRVHLIQCGLKNVYVVTTKKNMEKRKKDMESISLESSLYDKVTQIEICKIVAVEIEGKWFRGKLISFNEFVTDNTLIELIDYGSVYETKLENLFVLPYYFMYEPLVSKSHLHFKRLLESRKDLNSTKDSNIISVNNNMTIGHDNNESSLHLSRTFRKGSFLSEEKLNNVPLKNEDICILTYFKDFTCLYVGKAIKCGNNGSYNFVDYDPVINTAMDTDEILKYNPVEGDLVKVYSSEDDGFYRGKILKNNEGSYDVFYIDFGNIETVPSNVVYELADELKEISKWPLFSNAMDIH